MAQRLMMAALLACVCALAGAQTAASKYWKPDGKVACWPAPVGPGVGIKTDVQTADGWGYYVAWWCPVGASLDEQVGWAKAIEVTTHASAPKFDTGMLSGLLAANPADAQAVLNKAADLARKPPTGNYVAQFDRLWDKGLKALDGTRPPDPVWLVAPNGDAQDRPLYMVTNGARTTQSIGRAAIGATCGCTRLFLPGGWCPMKEGADYVVSLCKRVKG